MCNRTGAYSGDCMKIMGKNLVDTKYPIGSTLNLDSEAGVFLVVDIFNYRFGTHAFCVEHSENGRIFILPEAYLDAHVI